MTGRRRFWQKCPSTDQQSVGSGTSSTGTLVKIIGGVILLAAALISQFFASRNDDA